MLKDTKFNIHNLYCFRMGGHLSHLKPKPLLNVLNSTCGPVQGNLYRHVRIPRNHYFFISKNKVFKGNEEVHGYLGIPYAQPPIGILRFKKPVSADVWTETRDCTKYGPRCPPSGMLYENLQLPNTDIPDEANCLSLNVFCPQWEIKQSVGTFTTELRRKYNISGKTSSYDFHSRWWFRA